MSRSSAASGNGSLRTTPTDLSAAKVDVAHRLLWRSPRAQALAKRSRLRSSNLPGAGALASGDPHTSAMSGCLGSRHCAGLAGNAPPAFGSDARQEGAAERSAVHLATAWHPESLQVPYSTRRMGPKRATAGAGRAERNPHQHHGVARIHRVNRPHELPIVADFDPPAGCHRAAVVLRMGRLPVPIRESMIGLPSASVAKASP